MVAFEEKHERFKRLASQRTNNVLKSIKVLGNCSNKSSYAYTADEINKIFSEIDKQLKDTKALFRTSSSSKEFRL